MIAGAATLGAMSKSPNAKRVGGPKSWEELSRPDADQNQRFLAESLSLLLADLLRSVLSDASPALPADEFAVAARDRRGRAEEQRAGRAGGDERRLRAKQLRDLRPDLVL